MDEVPAPEYRRVFIDRPEPLVEVVEEFALQDAIGVDVEMAQQIERLPGGITRGKQLLALIQIAGGDVSLIVDPVRIGDLSALASLLSGSTVKVVLGGATDIELLEERDLPVENIIDLAEMAVSVFGHREEGMRALAQRALGIEIDKAIRREDWLRRPIHPAMIGYAHRDAELTLSLYRWFQLHHPELVESHVRQRYHPSLGAHAAPWIRRYLRKRLDAARLLKEEGIDPERESQRLERDVRLVAERDLSPGQRRRILRLIGELRLTGLYSDVLPYAGSPSSVFRASAARTLGRLRNEDARPILEKLRDDDLEDVRLAAQWAIKTLDTPLEPPKEVETPDDSGLDEQARAKLEQVRERLAVGQAGE